MANNNIDQRIRYRKGSGKPEQPKHEKLNGNVFSIFPIPHEKPWYEDKPRRKTMETKELKDLFHHSPSVKRLLGFMNIENTWINLDLEQYLYRFLNLWISLICYRATNGEDVLENKKV